MLAAVVMSSQNFSRTIAVNVRMNQTVSGMNSRMIRMNFFMLFGLVQINNL